MNKDEFLSEEEFAELYHSLSEEERIEVCRKLFEFGKANRESLHISEEKIAENEAKLERFIKVYEQKKAVENLKHRLETNFELAAQRIEAHLIDMTKTETNQFDGDDSKHRSH